MLRIASVEEIEALLLQLPDLVRLQEHRSASFPERTSAWLVGLEDALVANRLPQAGAVAALRSGLVAADQGLQPTGLEFRGRPTRSRVIVALASQAIQRAVAVAAPVVDENRPRLAEGERVAQQIVAAARARAGIPTRPKDATTTDYLRVVRRSLTASEDLENAMVHLEGLVGSSDALILLDRALSMVPEVATGGRQH
jgi:hypothetical protein